MRTVAKAELAAFRGDGDEKLPVAEGMDAESAVGKTATLELTPRQAEVLALAQSMGEISLSLRSLADSVPGNEPTAKIGDNNSGSVKVLKYGVQSRTFGVN